jgi:hypothetical protein
MKLIYLTNAYNDKSPLIINIAHIIALRPAPDNASETNIFTTESDEAFRVSDNIDMVVAAIKHVDRSLWEKVKPFLPEW